MSPYRVILVDKSGNAHIYIAMLSVKEDSGSKSILIVQRPYLNGCDLDPTELAYQMYSKRNSMVQSRYQVQPVERYYRLVYTDGKFSEELGDRYRTLFNCMVSAMDHFCSMNDLICLRVL